MITANAFVTVDILHYLSCKTNFSIPFIVHWRFYTDSGGSNWVCYDKHLKCVFAARGV